MGTPWRARSEPPGSIVIQGLGLTDPGIRRTRVWVQLHWCVRRTQKGSGVNFGSDSVQSRHPPPQHLHLLEDLGVVCAVGRVVIGGAKKPGVRLEIAQRPREVLEVVGKQSTVAELGDGRGIDGEQEPGDEARLRKRVHADVEALEIHERAHDNLRARRWLENAVVELGLGAHVLLEQLLAIVVIQQRATVEGSTIRKASPACGVRPRCVGTRRGHVRGS